MYDFPPRSGLVRVPSASPGNQIAGCIAPRRPTHPCTPAPSMTPRLRLWSRHNGARRIWRHGGRVDEQELGVCKDTLCKAWGEDYNHGYDRLGQGEHRACSRAISYRRREGDMHMGKLECGLWDSFMETIHTKHRQAQSVSRRELLQAGLAAGVTLSTWP